MTIDEEVLAEAAKTPSGDVPAGTTENSAFVSTWPLTSDELNDIERDLKEHRSGSATAQNERIPAAVRQ